MEDPRELETLYVVSHEAKTYVSNIFSTAQMIKRFDDIGQLEKCDVTNGLSMILGNCTKLQRLINNIIDLSAKNIASQTLEATYVDMVAFCNSLCEISDAEIGGAADITFKTNLDELFVYCDILKIERVLLNLISNSVKHSKEASKIQIELGENDVEWWFSVSDNGIGIRKDMRDKVFIPFMRHMEEEGTSIKGTGLGLAIVKKFVELHMGEVKIEDSELGGCKFTVRIPNESPNALKLKERSEVLEPNQDIIKQELGIS